MTLSLTELNAATHEYWQDNTLYLIPRDGQEPAAVLERLDRMLAAIGLPREKLCTYCWNGESHGEAGDDALRRG